MKRFFRILTLAAQYKGLAGLNILFNVLYSLFSVFSVLMVIPFLQVLFQLVDPPGEPPVGGLSVQHVIDVFNYRFSSYLDENGQLSGLVMICILVIVVFFFRNLCRYLAMYFLAPLRNGVVRDLRKQLFGKIVSLPVGYFSEKRKGDVIARMTTDVSEVEWSIMNVLEATFREPVMIMLYLVAMLVISPGLTAFVFLLLGLTALIITTIGKTLKRKSSRAQEKVGLILSLIEESLGGLRIIKAFNAERYQSSHFDREVDAHFRLQTSVLRRRDLSSPLSEFLGLTVVSVVLWFGGQNVLSGEIQPEVFIGYIIIFANLINPAKAFANAYYYIQRGMASVDRIQEVLEATNDIPESPNAKSLGGFDRALAYRDVNFSYDEEQPILTDINFQVEKGKMLAIVGASGAGKSTVVDLLPRFYDVKTGSITLDGTDIREIKIEDLRNQLGIVSQENILFNDSVHNNIAFGSESASREAVIEAAKIANAHDFISKMENGYDTLIGDRGHKLSGGERQRLTIARAVLADPPILILDEATSSLDTHSEKLVQDALFKLMADRTSIVIAHRLSTIQFADEIIVMQDGKIIERGNHTALMGRDTTYKRLVEMQAF